MRKPRFLAIACAALLAACLLPLFGTTAYAAESIKASEIAGTALELTDETTLEMDKDLSLTSIKGDSYALWINGEGALAVNNPDGDAISVGALISGEGIDIDATSGAGYAIITHTGDLRIGGDVKAEGVWGLWSAATVNVAGDVTATATDGMAVYASADGLTVTGNLTAASESQSAVYVRYGNCKVSGNVTATSGKGIAVNVARGGCEITGNANVTGGDGFQVSGTDVFDNVTGLKVGGNVTATAIVGDGSQSGIYVSSGPIVIGGDVVATSSNDGASGLAGIYASDGDITIGGKATAHGKTFGIYGKSVHVTGTIDAAADAESGVAGIRANDGAVTIGGGTASAGIYGIQAENGSVMVNGDITATSGSNYAIYVKSGDLTVTGDATATSAKAIAINVPKGSCEIGGNAEVSGVDGMQINGDAEGLKGLKVGGNLTATAVAGSSGSGSGVYVSNGPVSIGDDAVASSVDGGASGLAGIYAAKGDITIGGNATAHGKTFGIYGKSVNIAGTVDVTADAESGVAGIEALDGAIVIGGGTVTSHIYGIYAESGDVTINGDITATSDVEPGIYAKAGSCTITGSADVAGGDGIRTRGALTIGGDVRARGVVSSSSNVSGSGINASGPVKISGNADVCSADDGEGGLAGIFASGDIEIDGNATAKAKTFGIYSSSGKIVIHGDATASAATGVAGIYSETNAIDIGGNATAVGTAFGITGKSVKIGGTANAAADMESGTAGIRAFDGMVEIGNGAVAEGQVSAIHGNLGVKVTGDVTATSNRSVAILTQSGPCTITGDVTATSKTGAAINVAGGDCTIGGNATVTGADGIYVNGEGNGAYIGGDVIARAVSGSGSGSGIYVTSGPIKIDGNADVTSTDEGKDGLAGIYGNDVVEIGGDATAHGRTFGLYGKSVKVAGELDCGTSDNGVGGVYAFSGALELGGNVKAQGGMFGVYGVAGISIEGDVDAIASSESSGTFALFSPAGNIEVNGNTSAANKNPGGPACIDTGSPDSKMVFRGSVTTDGGMHGILASGAIEAYGLLTVPNAGNIGVIARNGADFYGNVSVTGTTQAINSEAGGVRFHGGTVKLAVTDKEGLCALYSGGTVECEGDITIDGSTYGIFARSEDGKGGGVDVKYGRLEATGSKMAILSQNPIEIDARMGVIEPEGGKVIAATYETEDETHGVYSVGLADNSPAAHAIITEADPVVKRIAGDYANETAALIAATAFPEGSEWVVIARDDDFADALGATGLAGVLQCPIILTDRFGLSKAAAQEVGELGAKHAYIIGGTGAIKDQVDADLAALGVAVEPRVWGENSYDTSLACAKKIEELGGDVSSPIIAMSTNFQDALSVSPVAYLNKLPVILQTWGATSADRGFTDEAKQFLAGTTPFIVGGPGAIADASFNGIALSGEPLHIYGETGYDTSNAIAEWAVGEGILGSRSVVIACGAQAPKGVDALAGSALAGKLGCPILLVNSNTSMESANLTTVEGFLTSHCNEIRDAYVLGGTYVVPEALYSQIEKILKDAPIRQKG